MGQRFANAEPYVRSYLIHFACGVLGLALTALLVGQLVSPPPDTQLVSLRVQARECEVLFVGPSYVQSQVLTDVVDAEARLLGYPLRTCKFAKTHLKGFEQYHSLRILMSQPWPKLKLVVYDVTLGADSGYVVENRFKPRVIRFHLPEIFQWYFRFWSEQKAQRGHPRQLLDHGLHVLARSLHVGVGAELLSAQSVTVSPKSKRKKGPKLMAEADIRRRLKRLLSMKERAKKTKLPPARRDFIRYEYDLIREHGFAAEAISAPVWSLRSLDTTLGQDGPRFSNFADPDKYPSLYTRYAHKRDDHLTKKGSQEYSRLLARHLVQRLKSPK